MAPFLSTHIDRCAEIEVIYEEKRFICNENMCYIIIFIVRVKLQN